MFRIGVYFDMDYITAGIVNDENVITKKEYIPTLKYRSFEVITKDIAELCYKICKDSGLDADKDIEYVGIACLGAVDSEKGIMIHTTWMHDFENAKLVEEMKKYMNIPVYAENNANCYALAESRIGTTKGYKNSVVVVLGTGISGGIILDNKIYHGSFYGAGEFGHHVIIHDGEECECGRKGCWNAYASSSAILRDARIIAIKHPESTMFHMVNGDLRLMSVDTIYKAAKMGDEFAKKVIDNYVKYVALGIVNIVNFIQPDIIAIGGRMSGTGDNYIKIVENIVREKAFGQEDPDRQTKIVFTNMDYDAVIIGAAMIK